MNEILKKAYEEQLKAYQDYHEVEKALMAEGNGFLSKVVLDNLHKAKENWQEKHNIFYTLLSKETFR